MKLGILTRNKAAQDIKQCLTTSFGISTNNIFPLDGWINVFPLLATLTQLLFNSVNETVFTK